MTAPELERCARILICLAPEESCKASQELLKRLNRTCLISSSLMASDGRSGAISVSTVRSDVRVRYSQRARTSCTTGASWDEAASAELWREKRSRLSVR